MKVIIVAISLLMTSQAFSKVWENQNQWNNTWERRYEHWVKTTWKEDIFTNPKSHFKGISTDCADATYTMRLAFSYLHKLPFKIKNFTKGNGKHISNDMSRWDGKSPRAKMMAFASYVNNMSSTKSLPGDTYPSSMDKIGLAPGGVYVSPGTHSYQLINMNRYGVLKVGSSTVPSAVRDIFFENNFPYYIPGQKKKDYSDGYRRFKWPQHLKTPSLQVPGTTRDQKLAQFKIAKATNYSYMVFNEQISRRLSKLREPMGEKVDRLQINLMELVWQRDNVIVDAQNKLAQIRMSGRRCMNYSEYDAHSTPSRDKRLKQNFANLKSLMTNPTYKKSWYNGREWNHNNLYSKRPLELIFLGNRNLAPNLKAQASGLFSFQPILLNRQVDYHHIWYALLDNRLSSDPNNSTEARWGFAGRSQSGCKLY